MNVPAPEKGAFESRSVANSTRSVVKVVGVATSCSLRIEGSGFVISPQHVLTNAHVVAGVTQDLTVAVRSGRVYPATVVFYDPERDIAILDVPDLRAAVLRFSGPAAYAANAVVAGYPENHPLTLVAARVGDSISAYGPNIYQSQVVHRQIYPIRALVEPGNSGGPLLAPDGRVYGVVFAASTQWSRISAMR